MTERKVKLDRANKIILLRALGDVYYGQRARGGSTEVTGRLILRVNDLPAGGKLTMSAAEYRLANAIGPTQIGKSTQQSALVYRVEDIAQMLSISLRAAYTLCNTTTDFRVLHIGTSIRVSKASFDAWLARIEEA